MESKQKPFYQCSQWVPDTVVALVTNIALQTLRNNRSNNTGIPFSKIGKSVRYYLPDVYAYMEAHKVETK